MGELILSPSNRSWSTRFSYTCNMRFYFLKQIFKQVPQTGHDLPGSFTTKIWGFIPSNRSLNMFLKQVMNYQVFVHLQYEVTLLLQSKTDFLGFSCFLRKKNNHDLMVLTSWGVQTDQTILTPSPREGRCPSLKCFLLFTQHYLEAPLTWIFLTLQTFLLPMPLWKE